MLQRRCQRLQWKRFSSKLAFCNGCLHANLNAFLENYIVHYEDRASSLTLSEQKEMWNTELKLYFLNSNNDKIYLHISKGHSLLLLQIVHNDKSQLQSEVSKASFTGSYIFYLSPCVPKNWSAHLQRNGDPPGFNIFYPGESNPWSWDAICTLSIRALYLMKRLSGLKGNSYA